MKRGLLTIITVALGVGGGALLGGCGSGQTKTVSVANSPPSETQSTSASASATQTTSTAPARSGTTPSATRPSETSTTTRTAAEPAFAQPQAANSSGVAGALEVMRARGFTANDTSTYHPNQTLAVLVGTGSSSAGGGQQAFFFVNGKYIGTDTKQPSASIRVVNQSDTEVTLAYPHGSVRFQLDNGKLTPLDRIPPVSARAG